MPMTQYEYIAMSKARGASIVETMKAVMAEYGISLAEAKTAVAGHPAFAGVVRAAAPLHELLDDLPDQEPDRTK